ncbi:unnamed protein product, partial [Tilletia caries]
DIGRQLVTAGDRFKPDHIEIEKVDFKAALATSQHLWDANIAIDVAWPQQHHTKAMIQSVRDK